MRRTITAVGILAATLTFTGCRSQQLAYDQNQFRQVLLGMYEDQLIDNLIRAKNRMPLLHLDYTNITGTVTHNNALGLGGGPGGTIATTYAPVAAARMFVRSATQAFTYGVNTSQINQLTVTANPIVDNSALYLAYVNFVEQPGRLMRTCDPPPPGAAHVVRQCGNQFYWVPEQYRNEYLEVALRTTGVRSDPSTAPAYYEVTFTGYIRIIPGRLDANGLSSPVITFRIDQPVPNDNGLMTAVVNGRECKFRLLKTDKGDFPEDEKDKDVSDNKDKVKDKDNDKYQTGTPTRLLKLKYVLDQNAHPGRAEGSDDLWSAPFPPDEVVKALTNHVVRVELDSYKPTAPAIDDTLGSIRTQAELLRLNQLQLLNK